MKKLRADTFFYHIGKIIWLPVILAGSWFAETGYENFGNLFACSFYQICGFPCPGCGGTRAVYYLFSGELAQSFFHHPAVLSFVFCYLHFMGLYFYRKHIRKTIEEKEIPIPYYMYGLIAVILLQWCIKLMIRFSCVVR